MRSIWTYIVATALACAWPASAGAQNQAFGDWAKQCESGSGGDERCYIIQTFTENGRPLMFVLVAYSAGRDKLAAMIEVPLGIHLPSGLDVRIGDITRRIDFQNCMPDGGCRAVLDLDDEMLTALKGGADMVIAGRGRDGAELDFPVSTQGFGEAFEAL